MGLQRLFERANRFINTEEKVRKLSSFWQVQSRMKYVTHYQKSNITLRKLILTFKRP